MKYDKLTLSDKVYYVNICGAIIELSINGILFFPTYLGPNEKLSLYNSYLLIDMENGTQSGKFDIGPEGDILYNEENGYVFEKEVAEQELIIIKTKIDAERNMGVQDLFEEGEHW